MKTTQILEELAHATAKLANESGLNDQNKLSPDLVLDHLTYYYDAGFSLVELIIELELEFGERYVLNIAEIFQAAGLKLTVTKA